VQERAVTAQLLDEVAHQDHVHLYHRLASPRATRRTLGLPGELAACVFDLDGILTTSGALHAAAWAETFDELLARRAERTGERFAPFRPFNPRVDYFQHINGRPRLDGIHAFLASRGIRLPEGKPGDPPGSETIHGLANRKNEALLRRLEREGVTAFAGASGYLEAAREAGLSCAVVSASANTSGILERAGLASLVDQRVDGNTIRAERLAPKPAPDTVLAACRLLGVTPEQAAAFETTIDGVTAARTAGFGLVVAVDRAGRAEMLSAHGADLVVADLAALLEPTPTG
jgi:HAD superfamily hydrolase (TIGR01509 family)